MRIAYFAEVFLPKMDGIVNTTCYLLDHLALRGHESILFAAQGAPTQYANTKIVPLTGVSLPLYPEIKWVPPVYSVSTTLDEFQPDIIHLINPVSLGLLGLWQAQARKIPLVAAYHTDMPGFAVKWGFFILEQPLWNYLRWIHNQADLNLCPSRFTEQELVNAGFERTRVWTRGVDTTLYHPNRRTEEWRAKLSGGQVDAPLLIFVSRLSPEKRPDWLYNVLDALPDVRLAFVGDGPSRPDLEKQFADTGRTVFAGYLRGEALASAYAAADIFCFPAANETFGNVVLEAMASGLPVVTANSGGVLDSVRHGENGLFFEQDDPVDFVAQVTTLVNDLDKAREMGQAGRAYAESRSWTAVLDGLLADYEGLLP